MSETANDFELPDEDEAVEVIRDRAAKIIERHVTQMMEEGAFDSVIVLTTRYFPDLEGTNSQIAQGGNTFANRGVVEDWLQRQREPDNGPD